MEKIPRPLYDLGQKKGTNWEFDQLKAWFMERGPHVDEITELPELKFLTGREILVDKKKG